MADTHRKVEVTAIVIATVVAVAALVVSGVSLYMGKERADEANRIASSALRVAEDQRYTNFTISAFVKDNYPSQGLSSKTTRLHLNPKNRAPAVWRQSQIRSWYFWLGIQVINTSNVPLILNDIGIMSSPHTNEVGLWIYSRSFATPDCKDGSTDVRCYRFPVQIQPAEKKTFFWPIWEDVNTLRRNGAADPVRIGISATPMRKSSYHFRTNMRITD
ncbi:hypothetical protein [Gordonia sp. CPCC 205333]|uniref:hypothetical protein n=1 Tax=Gordonia sp. CPCC 205333 TaxID=3140790 RepID=UPI003AF3AB3D